MIVCINAESPSKAKNSDWRGISVVSDATNELIVNKPSAGGQSTKIKSKSLISFVNDRLGHDKRYALNIKKIKKELNWQTKTKLSIGLKKTIMWYLENKKILI